MGWLNIGYPANADFYLSPTGDDTNSGTYARPWRTLTKARNYLRTINATMANPLRVHLAEGDYTGVALTDLDSGFNGHCINYLSDDGPGAARVLGGTIVTGWSLYSGSIYRVNIGATAPSTLYENGIRARKARSPGFTLDAAFPLAKNTYRISEGVNASHTVLQYQSGDLNLTGLDLTDAQVVVWSGGATSLGPGTSRAWFDDTLPFASVNIGARQITVTQDSRYDFFQGGGGSRFFVQGVLDWLDGPGQFHYESATGWLYYWPRDGAIAAQEIIVPTTVDTVTIQGTDTTHRVSNVYFGGLQIGFSDFVPWYRHASVNDNDRGGGPYDRQYSMPMAQHGAVLMENTDNITFDSCLFKCAGMHGIYAKGYNQYNAVQNSWAEQIGHSGYYVEGNYPGTTDVNKLWKHYNLRINDFGQLAGSGVGIAYANSGSNWARYLDIHDGPRIGIFIFAYTGFPSADIYGGNNVVEFFKLRNLAQDSGDVSGLYFFGLSSDGKVANLARQGIIDNINSTSSVTDIVGNAVFCDNETANQTVQHVKCTNIAGADTRTAGDPQNFLDIGPSATVDTANIGTTAQFPFA